MVEIIGLGTMAALHAPPSRTRKKMEGAEDSRKEDSYLLCLTNKHCTASGWPGDTLDFETTRATPHL